MAGAVCTHAGLLWAAAGFFIAVFAIFVWLDLLVLTVTWDVRANGACDGCRTVNVTCTHDVCDPGGDCVTIPGLCECPNATSAAGRCLGNAHDSTNAVTLGLFTAVTFIMTCVMLCLAVGTAWKAMGLSERPDTDGEYALLL